GNLRRRQPIDAFYGPTEGSSPCPGEPGSEGRSLLLRFPVPPTDPPPPGHSGSSSGAQRWSHPCPVEPPWLYRGEPYRALRGRDRWRRRLGPSSPIPVAICET